MKADKTRTADDDVDHLTETMADIDRRLDNMRFLLRHKEGERERRADEVRRRLGRDAARLTRAECLVDGPARDGEPCARFVRVKGEIHVMDVRDEGLVDMGVLVPGGEDMGLLAIGAEDAARLGATWTRIRTRSGKW